MNPQNSGKVVLLFGIILLGFFVFLLNSAYLGLFSKRDLPKLVTSKSESASRGEIYSNDNFNLASSKKLYKAIVNTYNINPEKKELFVSLFSIYSKIPKKEIYETLKESGNVVLSYNIDAKTAVYLKKLAYKLNVLGVFQDYTDKEGRTFRYGLSVLESGEKREYTYKDTLEPLLGYIKKHNKGDLTTVIGVKGVEKYYESRLEPLQDGYAKGLRDLGFNIILNNKSIYKERLDGFDIYLNIPLKLQKKLERILDKYKEDLNAKEIIAAIMESDTGKILSLATSNRFDPNEIRQSDYPSLNLGAIETSFEPGSVLKPVVYSLLLEKKLINPYEVIDLHNGKYKLGKRMITDTHKLTQGNMEDIIIHSSNIGMAIISQRLQGEEYYEGLERFGFSRLTKIDLPYENVGLLPKVSLLNDETYKATVSYGYGLRATFIQILNAFNVFNNDGYSQSPRVLDYLQSPFGERYGIKNHERTKVLNESTAESMKQLLIKNVKKGTGRKTDIIGIEVGGKTGTAHIARDGAYVDAYNSSFFGFANDGVHRYTIGAVVFEPNKDIGYFASETAVPIFKESIELLVREGYLQKTAEASAPTELNKAD